MMLATSAQIIGEPLVMEVELLLAAPLLVCLDSMLATAVHVMEERGTPV